MTQLNKLLQDEKFQLNKERQTLQEDIAAAEKRLHEIQVRLRHVEGLLGTNDVTETVSSQETNSVRRSLTDIAEEILREREREPMYYKELAAEVEARGGDLTGENAANILVARLVNDKRFVRPVRKGFYALRSDYPNAKNVGERRRRRGSS